MGGFGSLLGLPDLSGHVHRLGVYHHLNDLFLIGYQGSEEVLCSLQASVLNRQLGLTITAHDNKTVATGLVLLIFLGVAL